ncbi:ceramide synthase 2 [Pangasianodon hypophthalmus]|uniref:ceramide synthase 2 n=1 Tax=Pangasianodon hypophthalmus TaxID=310915 RepID=UPI000EFF67B0|nr:ceramide synthase 2 [Pangasianodon hypophthalmus]XP_053083696.1 ceramide synthase 2 [Pangasianodon hypophthalmus]
MELIDEWLWRQEYWLPPGITWKDLEQMEGSPFPRDLLISLPLALGFIGLRKVFERSIAVPLSRLLGVKDKVRLSASPAPSLEAFYTKHSRQPAPNELSSLMKQSGLTQKQVEIWFHHRRNQDRPSHTKKFCEASWRFVFYLISFTGGLTSLISTPWFWEQKECWRGYPQQRVENVHYWYYMLELGFYWSLLLCVSVDIKRKDFKEQIIHHIATIFLLGFSYCANYIRIGTLVMLVHDSSDFLLESAKMFNYAGWKKTCDSLFVVFAVVFLVTRLVVFPSKIIYTTLISSMEVFQPFVGYYFFNSLLLVLQFLHIFWAWLILRMIYKFLFLGKLDKDERSDDESEADEDEEEDGDEEEDQASWRKRKVVLDSKLAMMTSSCVLNNLANQRVSVSSRTPKAR